MKNTLFKRIAATIGVAAMLACASARSEDIDLFANSLPASAASRPNVLIMVDNSANWSRNDQQWPGGVKQGESEMRALYRLMDELGDNVNVGLMMFTPGSGQNKDGAYVRYAVRQMTVANRAAFKEMIGTAGCPAGNNSLTGTPNCILKNFDTSSEKVGSAKTDYSAGLFEVFKYFGGFTSIANANNNTAGAPVSATQFGPLRYAGDPDPKSDPNAYVNGAGDPGKKVYFPPVGAANACAQNVLIFIGNGFPSADALPSLLSGVGGSTTQLLMPNPGGGFIQPTGSEIKYPDEWAKFLFSGDANSAEGRQGIAVYTIDVFNKQPDLSQNRLLASMAKHGGGKYFTASSEDAILQAMRDILIDVQSVNSVFTSAALPINATNRTQFENQVYIGMFRPDSDGRPRWLGNLKRYQVGFVNNELRLTDRNNQSAIAASTGFLQSCATSYWTTDSGNYWQFSPQSASLCPGVANVFSDLPDGASVEKGGAGEVIRRNNDPSVINPPFTVNRNLLTCASSTGCSSLVAFNSTNVTQARTGAANATEHTRIIDFTLGKDLNDDTANGVVTDSRPSLHGDVIHSQPLPVSYGGSTGVVLFYGANDGTFRALSGTTGKELWAFVAPEHHSKLKRLADNSPVVATPGIAAGIVPTPTRKDYFFDGTAALYQTEGSTNVWIFPSMRRGGRMVYALDVTTPATPTLKWRFGCPNKANDDDCVGGGVVDQIGETWSTPRIALVKGYDNGKTPIMILGGGYDPCEDDDSASPSCNSANVKGKRVFIIDASNGVLLATFTTERSVAADVSLVDRNGDGFVDVAYVADTGGNLYRIDFVQKTTPANALAVNSWAITKVARTQGAGRKFLFGPAVVAAKDRVYVALGSGDRERPLINQYPYVEDVKNRFYVFVDRFSDAEIVDLDGEKLSNFSDPTTCTQTLGSSMSGWFMDLASGRGEQTVTSPLIFGGLVFFSTNRATPQVPGTCTPNLGEARGYAVNLINASGAVGTQATCGGQRSGIFTGGGLPPSPVTATLPVGGKSVSVLFGAIHRSGGASSAIGAQQMKPSLSSRRTRMYWYVQGNR